VNLLVHAKQERRRCHRLEAGRMLWFAHIGNVIFLLYGLQMRSDSRKCAELRFRFGA